MSFINSLGWRYATKRMTGEKIASQDLESILEAARFAPTSMGLQPFSVVVIEDEAIREQLSPVCYNQPQIKEASALLVFSIWDTITPERVDSFIQSVADQRELTVESLEGYKTMVSGSTQGKTQAEQQVWAARQAYISLGFALAAAAELHIDSTPMEGFSPEGVDKVLGLGEKGLTSVVILAIGKRNAEEDHLAHVKKTRREEESFFIRL